MDILRGHLLQLQPAVPIVSGCLGDLPQQTSPFGKSTFDIPVTHGFAHEPVTRYLMRDDIPHHLRTSRPIRERQSELQVARVLTSLIDCLANRTQSSL